MSFMKRYADDIIANLSQAVDEPYANVYDWFWDLMNRVGDQDMIRLDMLTEKHNTTDEDIFEYFLLAVWYKPEKDGRPIDPIDFVDMMLEDRRNQNETGTQNESAEAQSDTM